MRDTREGIAAIDWTAAGKVRRVVRTDGTVIRACLKIAFGSEPKGFRDPAEARNPRRAGSSARVEQRRLGATSPRRSPKGNFVIGSTFAYGAGGQRIMKEVIPAQGDAYREHYVRDAQGNTNCA